MIQYVTTKIVSAWPEARQDQPGYGVGYADGYISWCPKAQFEEAAVVLGNIGHLSKDQQNAVAELAQLDERIEDLALILTDRDAVAILDEDEYERMQRQLEAMELYSAFLAQRVNAFPDAPPATGWTMTL